MLRPADATACELKDVIRIAMTADWGTGLYGAPEIARQMQKRGPFDLLLHLGDVYYAGTKDEVQERMLDLWPKTAGNLTRVLNSNHEMYSGGYGYFDLEFQAFHQTSSYFAFRNQHWLLIFLDTAYVDHDLDAQQVGWLFTLIGQAGRRKIVLFSHQQLYSRLDVQGPKLRKALAAVLDGGLITAWYWGHEHQCVLHDLIQITDFLPAVWEWRNSRTSQEFVIDAHTERMVGSIVWKRLGKTGDSPSCLVLDGPNYFIKGEEDKFVPHGFMTLEFNGPILNESVLLADGTEIFQNEIR